MDCVIPVETPRVEVSDGISPDGQGSGYTCQSPIGRLAMVSRQLSTEKDNESKERREDRIIWSRTHYFVYFCNFGTDLPTAIATHICERLINRRRANRIALLVIHQHRD